MTTSREQLRLLVARLDAALAQTLARYQRHSDEAAERLRSAAERTRVVDRDGAALIGPVPGGRSAHLTVGDLTLIPPNRAVRGTREVKLSPVEFGVLRLLMTTPGRVVSHERILNEIWGPGRGTKYDLWSGVHRLRAKIGDQPRRIESVYGRAYVLRAPGLTDPAQHGAISVGNLVLNPLTRTATRDGRPLSLFPTPFDMLERLMRTPGQVVRRDELAHIATRPGGAPATRVMVKDHMLLLRGAMGEPKLIHNVRGVGWYLAKS